MSFVWAFCVSLKALLHSHAAHSFYWILKPLPSAKRFYFGVSFYVGGRFPPSLHASFIAIFRTQSLLETFLSPFYYTVSSFRAASSCSQGQRRKQELKLPFWAAWLMPTALVLNTGVQFLEHRAARTPHQHSWVDVFRSNSCAKACATSLCFGCRAQWLLKKGARICSIYSKSSLSPSIC